MASLLLRDRGTALLLTLVLLTMVLVVPGEGARAQEPYLALLTVKGAINPVVARYLERALDTAEEEGARAAVIQLDTPGGLDNSMREIIQRISRARIPIIVYVAPAGARAASAGAFITMAAHVAAMAPNTAIGAAHPVAAGGQQVEGTLEEKIVNDAVAYIKGIAKERQRNVEWAEKAVRESVSASAQEALELGVVDLLAPDVSALLTQLEGRKVKLLTGETTLKTADVPVRRLDMMFHEGFLYAISDPNIAFILLSLAMTGIFLELSNPGAILPGIVGGIFLLLGLVALGTLPFNFGGLLLILLGFLFFLAELLVASHGMLAVGGAISLALGGLFLFSSTDPYFRVALPVLIGVVGSISAFFFFAVGAIVRSHRRRSVTGREGLVGALGVARSPLDPSGVVLVQGERWNALAQDSTIEAGETVRVAQVDGFVLKVEKVKKEG